MDCQIISSKGHYEIIINGKFYCSADTLPEAEREIEDYISAQREICCATI